MPDKAGAFAQLGQRRRAWCRHCGGRAGGAQRGVGGQAPQQQHSHQREQRSEQKSATAAAGCHHRTGQRRAGGKGEAARKLKAAVGARQRFTRHQRRHHGWRSDAERHRAYRAGETQQRQRRHRQSGARCNPGQSRQQRHRQHADRLGCDHHAPARGAVGPQAQWQRKQQERQALCRCEQTDLARARVERKHRDDGHGSKADLLRSLRGEVGAGKVPEGAGQAGGEVGGHGVEWVRLADHGSDPR